MSINSKIDGTTLTPQIQVPSQPGWTYIIPPHFDTILFGWMLFTFGI
jgi:hypothetical protein